MKIAQTYATTISDQDSGSELTYIVIPARSVAKTHKRAFDKMDVAALLPILGLHQLPTASDIISPSVLPLAIRLVLSQSSAAIAAQQLQSLMTFPYRDAIAPTQETARVAFAEYCVFAELIPFEASPPEPKALATIMAAGVTVGGGVGAVIGKATLVGVGVAAIPAAAPALLVLTALGILIGATAAAAAYITVIDIIEDTPPKPKP